MGALDELIAQKRSSGAATAPSAPVAASQPAAPRSGALDALIAHKKAGGGLTGAPSAMGGHAPGVTAQDRATPQNPFRGVQALYGGAKRVAGEAAAPVLNLLARPSDAMTSGIAAAAHGRNPVGAAWDVVRGSTDMETRGANLTEVTPAFLAFVANGGLAGQAGASGLAKLVQRLPAPVQEAVVATVIDPTTYLGGSGAIEHVVGAGGRTAMIAGTRATRLHPLTERVARELYAHLTPGGKNVGIAKYNLITEPAAQGTTLRQTLGNQMRAGERGLQEYTAGKQLMRASANTEHALANTMIGRLRWAVRGLAKPDEHAVYAALDKGTVDALPANLKPRAVAIRDTWHALSYLEGDQQMRDLLKHGAAPPAAASVHAAPTTVSLTGMGTGIADAMYDRLWADVEKGITTEAGAPSAMMQLAQQLKVVGRLTSRDEFKQLAQAVDAVKQQHRGAAFQSAMQSLAQTWKPGASTASTAAHAAPQAAAHAGFALPPELATFDSPVPRDIMRAYRTPEQGGGPAFRKHYMPHPADLSPEEQSSVHALKDDERVQQAFADYMRSGRTPADRAKLDAAVPAEDKNLLAREQASQLAPTPAEQRAVNEARIRGGARAIGTHDLGQAAVDRFGRKPLTVVPGRSLKPADLDTELQRLLTPTEHASTATGNVVKGVTGAPKYAFYFIPFRHMLNIEMLAALADPLSAAKATVRYGLSGAWLPETIGMTVGNKGFSFRLREAAQQLPLVKHAAASEARALDAALKAGAIEVNPERDIPMLIANTPILRDLYRWSGDTLWHFDDMQKATRYDALVKRGMTSADAAARVGSELIDYGDKSELTRKLAYIAPFAAYRSKLPGAVLRATARHPERVLAMERTAPGLTGGYVDAGDEEQARSGLPLADVLDASADPKRYARSTLGALFKDAVTAGLGLVGGKGSYLTYGQPNRDIRAGMDPNLAWGKLVLNQYLGTTMGADQVLSALGANEFDPKDFATEQIGGASGVYLSKKR